MYAPLWRILPGPVWVKIVILLVLLALVLAALHFYVYPLVQSLLPTAPGIGESQ